MLDRLKEKISLMLSRERMQHTLGVQKVAIELAAQYDIDAYKAEIAALLHDCAKDIPESELLSKCNEYGVELDDISLLEPELIHAPLGAKMAQRDFKIQDEEILKAIECHTTGCIGMSKLDKIIFLADLIEPGRDFPGVSDIRRKAFENLDEAVVMAMDNKIGYVLTQKKLLHLNTIYARNYIVKELYYDRGGSVENL